MTARNAGNGPGRHPVPSEGAVMDKDLVRLKQNIARIRRDIRLQAWEMQQLIDADLDCSSCAQLLRRMQADLKLYLEKRERLLCKA
jgi:hypothetical protein